LDILKRTKHYSKHQATEVDADWTPAEETWNQKCGQQAFEVQQKEEDGSSTTESWSDTA